MGQQVTHEILYLDKNLDEQSVRVFGEEEKDDVVSILEYNNATYIVEKVQPKGYVRWSSNQEA